MSESKSKQFVSCTNGLQSLYVVCSTGGWFLAMDGSLTHSLFNAETFESISKANSALEVYPTKNGVYLLVMQICGGANLDAKRRMYV